MTGPDAKLFHCPALTALKAVSGKWKTRILWLLRDRPHHFNELKRTLPGVSAKVLTEQLQQLQDDGIIDRQEETRDGVPHMVCSYSAYGRTLIPVLDALGQWGLIHGARQEEAPQS
ncbi:helix-turn-helix domain-containing protein [Cognatiyoonia sp. IB215182]|uniref:winged helix-turn-helix transcriptional regulator n=1 Tax=Cognatiyoonia sp. IB215182 TaxID=3097353 RepID=UPI002A10D04C|nr:helix-turn-helix domain-containing protein [Cognatiyoonia sp. IB215182]MDX8353821.1 helix-turn-helix domain-containing protein [Cognatiyoonia sp. IB215182]